MLFWEKIPKSKVCGEKKKKKGEWKDILYKI